MLFKLQSICHEGDLNILSMMVHHLLQVFLITGILEHILIFFTYFYSILENQSHIGGNY